MIAVAAAVGHAHAHGVIHRDLKPANVLIDLQSRPRVADFGLARHTCHEALTGSSQVLGTPGYLPPEQALGGEIGPQSDVYGLGGILYYLLTGMPPFRGKTVAEVIYRSVHEPPVPPTVHNPQVPAGLEQVCLRCLDKDPARRFSSASAFAEALAAADQYLPIDSSTNTTLAKPVLLLRPRRQPPPWLVGVSAAACVLAVAIAFRSARTVKPGVTNLTHPVRPTGATATHHPVRPTELGEPPPVVAQGDFGLKVTLLGSRLSENGEHLYTEGQEFIIKIEVDRDAHVGIWGIDANNNTSTLFPNPREKDTLVQAGVPRVIPRSGLYVFRTTPSEGTEKIQVVASTKDLPTFEGRPGSPVVTLRVVVRPAKTPDGNRSR